MRSIVVTCILFVCACAALISAQSFRSYQEHQEVFGGSLPVFEMIGEGVNVSADRALVPIRRSYDELTSLVVAGADPGQVLDAIEQCIDRYQAESGVNLFRLRESLESCVTDKLPHGTNPGPVLDAIQDCVESKLTSAEQPVDIIELVRDCIGDIKNRTSRVSYCDCMESAGAVYEGYLPTVGAAIVRFDTDNVNALRERLTELDSLDCPGLIIDADGAVPVVYVKKHADNDQLTFPNHLAYSAISSSPAASYVESRMTPLNIGHVAIIDDYLDPSYGQNGELANIDCYDMCQAIGQLGQATEPSTYLGIDSHGSRLAGIIAGADNGAGNNGVLRGIPASYGKLSFFKTQCSPDEPGIDVAMVLAAMETIIKERVPGIRVVCLGFGFQGLPDREMNNYKRLFKHYFTSLQGSRILWVASVGNDGSQIDADEVYPAGLSQELDNVVSVAAYDPVSLLKMTESNYGAWVDVSAPGKVYTATAPGGYGMVSGTSAAAALVTGSMGLTLAADSGLSPRELCQLLQDLTLRREIVSPDFPSSIDVEKIVQKLIPFRRVTRSGKSKGTKDASTGLRQPGLGMFTFNFVGDGDEEIKKIGIQYSQTNGNLSVTYKNEDKPEYLWGVEGVSLPYGTIFRSVTQKLYKDSDGHLNVPVTAPDPQALFDEHVIAITGCECRFTDGDDHHIKRFGVGVSRFGANWGVGAIFGDDSTHPWTCTIHYAIIGRHRLEATESFHGEDAISSDIIPVIYFPDLLGDFSLEFVDGDNELDRLAIFRDPGAIKIRFNDKNNDDKFDWRLTYYRLRSW